MRSPFASLSQHPDLTGFWVGSLVSVFGSQVTLLALPLTAVLLLDVSPGQIGVLGAAERAPFLLLGLFAGAWVDRLRRRPLTIVADLDRAVLLGSIPVAAQATAPGADPRLTRRWLGSGGPLRKPAARQGYHFLIRGGLHIAAQWPRCSA
jgi:MFS family permease